MLPERISYHNDLPFSITFSNIARESPHYHREMEMALILLGTAKYKIHHQDYSLSPGDILIVDTEDLHHIYESSEDVLILTMYINLEYFTDLYPNIDFMIFACEECGKESAARHQELQNKLSFLRHHLAELMMLCASKKENDQLLMEKIHQFIFMMVNQFQGFFIEDNQFRTSKDEINSIDLDRLYRIIKYIYINYDQKITLDDLAELEHLSPYYISHLIKETSGLSFQNFLNYVRVEYAEKFLAENKMTLTQISEFCGFSSSSYFNKCFSAWHHLTPAQYRKQLQLCERSSHKPFSQEEALSLLKPYLNTYSKQENHRTSKNLSHHIFVPIKAVYTEGRDFRQEFPLHISVNSLSDLMRLGYFAPKLAELNPASVKIPKAVLDTIPHNEYILADLERAGIKTVIHRKSSPSKSRSANTVAEAFAALLDSSPFKLDLFSSHSSLFTPDGLPTPYYSLYRLFSGIDGNVVERREQYILVKNSSVFFALFYQKDSSFSLNVHLHFKALNGDSNVVQTTFTKEHSAAAALKSMGHPQKISGRLEDHLYQSASGAIRFSRIKNSSDANLDLIIEPNTFVLLEITQPREP